MLSPEAGDAAIARLRELVDPGKMDLTIAVVKAAKALVAGSPDGNIRIPLDIGQGNRWRNPQGAVCLLFRCYQ